MMLMIILIVMTLASIAAVLELPPLIRKAWTKEVVIYSVMLISGSILSIVALQGIQLTSPMKLPEVIYKPIYNWMQYILQIKR